MCETCVRPAQLQAPAGAQEAPALKGELESEVDPQFGMAWRAREFVLNRLYPGPYTAVQEWYSVPGQCPSGRDAVGMSLVAWIYRLGPLVYFCDTPREGQCNRDPKPTQRTRYSHDWTSRGPP